MKKTLRFIKDLLIHFGRDFSIYFYKGWQAHLFCSYMKSFVRSLIFYLNQCRIYLYSNGIQQHHIREEKIKKLQTTSLGLHSLLPSNAHFSYTILLPVNQPHPSCFQESLESIVNQTASCLDILIGLMHPPSKEIKEILDHLQKRSPHILQIFHFYHIQDKETVINQLAEKSSGNFLFIMEEEDWIRPDLLFRYEQTLRIFSDSENRILYCNLNNLNDRGYFIPNSEYSQPASLCFPFFFKPFVEQGLLIPRSLWKKVKGLQTNFKGAVYENLLLQLDLIGAAFQHVPFCLYSLRSNRQRTLKSQLAFLEALKNYSYIKQLDWQWHPGYQNNHVRAIPSLPKNLTIQVIIPYKDQKNLTIKCIQSVLKQKEISIHITAIDNRSQDTSIAEEIRAMGGEVIVVDEPFNYSRLNNLAVTQTQHAGQCEILLFLNNDVELESDALEEMLRWIHQPQVGIVGCRLHYPDGRLQHGGVNINFQSKEEMRWEHVEKLRPFEEMKITKTLGIFDAVTAACAMIKRQTFIEIGGFDEIWYPVGYSDTDLATKVRAKGLICFYTPYAVGIHHESISRKSSIEDYENSWWLYHLLQKEKAKPLQTHFQKKL